MRKVLLLAALSMAATLVFAPAVLAQDLYDCSDFVDQGQAQENFNNLGPGDPSGLDTDDDGIACEALPTVVDDGTPDGSAIPGDPESATPTATSTAEADDDQYATPSATASASPLPETGGPVSVMALAPLALLVGTGIMAFRIMRRS